MHRRLATLHARRAALLRDLAVVEDEFAAALRAAADAAANGEWVRLERLNRPTDRPTDRPTA